MDVEDKHKKKKEVMVPYRDGLDHIHATHILTDTAV